DRAEPTGTLPFSAFEWMMALRYLRARRKEGVISVIAAIALLCIALGVALLIIVMSVMNGFRTEFRSKILGLNGHVIISPVDTQALPFSDYDEVTKRVRSVPGVT